MMKKASIALVILMLATLACSMQDLSNLQAGINGTYAISPSPAPPAQNAALTDTRAEQKGELSSQGDQSGERYSVCTGNPTGNLRVRITPGTGAAQVALLAEGTEITVLAEEEVQEDGSTWAEVAEPAGWVNARFLCPQE